MSVYRISYRYANSFFQLAVEKKSLKDFAEDVELIYNTLLKSKELRSILRNPVIKQKDKKNLLLKIFGSKVKKETSDFLDFLVTKGREDIIMEIMKEFLNLRDEKEGILRTNIISSVELTDDVKKNLITTLEKRTSKKVKTDYSIDPDIIGGFIVQIKDTVYDASVKHQLELLRKKFSQEISI